MMMLKTGTLLIQRVLEVVAGATGASSVNGIEIPEHGSGSELFFFF
jgi:hypothetical protein